MSEDDIGAFNWRSSEQTWNTSVGLSMAGITWAGVMCWDDIRTVDYLVSRPEVDPDRIGCCGLSVGAYRAVHLAGLDERIKAAVVVGWMCSFPAMLQNKLTSIGPMKIIPGLYQSMDLPDIAAMTCPGALMCIHGTRDELFTNEGVQAAYSKITNIYAKAGLPERFDGVTYDGPHEFNLSMQEKAFTWLERWLVE
jgi:dienelactone hydrolase